MAPQRPRVLIVDDHPVVRMGLRALIEQSGRSRPAHPPRRSSSPAASGRISSSST